MAERGYLLIADITGYTRFLTGSELDHAQGVLQDLFAVILDQLKSPFALSNIQGDAFLSYALDDEIAAQGQIFDAIEALYFAFHERLGDIRNNTTCTCRACSNAGKLDLKFIVHHGEFVVQRLAGRVELAGSDVILLHRLLKNDVTAQTGIAGYALFTEAAATALSLDVIAQSARPYQTEVEEFGPLAGRVIDFGARWHKAHAATRIAADPDSLWFPPASREYECPIDVAWEAFWNPEKRGNWFRALTWRKRVNGDAGHLATGAVDHCAHGDVILEVHFVDVRPLSYATVDTQLPLGGHCRQTFEFEGDSQKTRITILTERPVARNFVNTAVLRIVSDLKHKRRLEQEIRYELEDFGTYLDSVPHGAPAAVSFVSQDIQRQVLDVLRSG